MEHKRICNIALFATSIFAFIIWSLVNTIDLSIINNPMLRYIVTIFINFIFAYGFFNLFVSLLVVFLKKVVLIKKIILGASYVEGIWIGYYTTNNIDILCYQIIEQDSDNIQIIGEAYRYDDRSYFAKWKSDSIVSIDSSTASLSYMYTFDSLGNDFKFTGFANANLLEKGSFKNPKRMNGYYFTLKSKQKTKSTFIKIFDGQSDKCKDKTEDLIQKAYDLFLRESNQTNLPRFN